MKNNRNTRKPFERWSLFSSGSSSDDECCHSSLERQFPGQWYVYLAWCPVGLSSHPCCVSVHRKGKTMLWVMAMLWSWSQRSVLLIKTIMSVASPGSVGQCSVAELPRFFWAIDHSRASVSMWPPLMQRASVGYVTSKCKWGGSCNKVYLQSWAFQINTDSLLFSLLPRVPVSLTLHSCS